MQIEVVVIFFVDLGVLSLLISVSAVLCVLIFVLRRIDFLDTFADFCRNDKTHKRADHAVCGRERNANNASNIDSHCCGKLGSKALGIVKFDNLFAESLHDLVAKDKKTESDTKATEQVSSLNAHVFNLYDRDERADGVCHVIRAMTHADHHSCEEHQVSVNFFQDIMLHPRSAHH